MVKAKKLKAEKRENAKLERKLAKSQRRIEELHALLVRHEAEKEELLARLGPQLEEDEEPEAMEAVAVPAVPSDAAVAPKPKTTARRRSAKPLAEQATDEE